MAKNHKLPSDEQWAKIAPLLPDEKPVPEGERRRRRGNREVLETILWVLRCRMVRRRDLPRTNPGPSTRRWWPRELEERDIWLEVWRSFLGQLNEAGLLGWKEAFVDAGFTPAKKGAPASGLLKGRKVQSGWRWSTAKVFRREVARLPPYRWK